MSNATHLSGFGKRPQGRDLDILREAMGPERKLLVKEPVYGGYLLKIAAQCGTLPAARKILENRHTSKGYHHH